MRSLAVLLLAAAIAHAEPMLHVRLLTPLTSYDSRPGAEFRMIVITPYVTGGVVRLPAGTLVLGTVNKARRVGFGLLREQATLGLAFQKYELPDGRSFAFSAMLRHIDNAREKVNSRGQVRGILAANSPQSLVGGLWHMPDLERFTRSFAGLTGAGGQVATRFAMGPIGMAGIFVARCALFRMPEPEIQLKPGTEMFVQITELPEDAPSFAPEAETPVDPDLGSVLADLPYMVEKPKGVLAADVINVALAGSEEELRKAFRAAGWQEAEPMTAGSLSRMYKAYATQRGYPTAPVSRLVYDDREPDLVYQKSLNTIEKRHHIRLWKTELGGREIWLGAATHDVGAKFGSSLKFSHRIHPRIDWERSKVISDLTFTGCSAPAGFVSREQVARDSQAGVITDGRLAVLVLKDTCNGRSMIAPEQPAAPKSKVSLMARRMVLEGRQYVLRGNPYYWTYRVISMKRSQPVVMGIDE